MSNEFSILISVQCSNGNFSLPFSVNTQANQTTQGASAGTMATSTSPAAIPFGSVTTPGIFCCRNLDATNDIQLLSGSTVFGRVKAGGEPQVFRIDSGITSGNLKAQSVASTPLLDFILYSA